MTDLKEMYRKIVPDNFPEEITITLGDIKLVYKKRTWQIPDPEKNELVERGLRYGENPDQEAALYELVEGQAVIGGEKLVGPGLGLVSAISEAQMIQAGKHPGKINLTDLDNGLNIIRHLSDSPAAVILKHNNPCGVALGDSIAEAYTKADMADRIAAFGGCLVVNRPLDRGAAQIISENYLEVVAAPQFEEGAAEILAKRPNLRVIELPRIADLREYQTLKVLDIKSLMDGGLVLQTSQANAVLSASDLKPATATYEGKEYRVERAPNEDEIRDMLFGWAVELGVTSNSVIYVKDGVTVGIGTGEQDRVGVAEIAVFKAYTKYADRLAFEKYNMPYKELELAVARGERDEDVLDEIDEATEEARGGIPGSVMVSDAFFPFRDGVDVGLGEGATGIVQAGGSMRDFEVIEAVNDAGATMVFTGQRVFKH